MLEFFGFALTVIKIAVMLIGAVAVIGIPIFAIWCGYGVYRAKTAHLRRPTIVGILLAGILLGFGSTAMAQGGRTAMRPPAQHRHIVMPTPPATKLCTPSIPEEARLEKYPFASGSLTMDQIATLGLRPARLRWAMEVYNFHRNPSKCGGGDWVREWLQAGEMMLVGPDGYVAYRASCGNRVVWVPKPTTTPAPAPTAPKPSASATPGPMGIGEMTFRVITYPIRIAWSFWTHPWRSWTAPVQ